MSSVFLSVQSIVLLDSQNLLASGVRFGYYKDWKARHEAEPYRCPIRLPDEVRMQSEEEKQAHLTENQGQFTKGPAYSSQDSKRSGTLRCPKCEGSRIRKRSILLSFLITIAVFVIFLLLREVVALLQLTQLGLTFAFVLMFSFCAISAAAWSGLVERHRCRSCGHRFRPTPETQQEKTEIPFHWKFCLLNGIIIFVVCATSRQMLRFIFHGAFPIILMEAILAAVPSGFLIALSLPYQAVVHHIFRTRLKNNLLWAILFMLPAIAIGTNSLYHSLPAVAARRILSHGELAPLPESATEIKVYTWSSLFSGEEFLRFRASPRDIEQFLDESPILQDAECEKFSRDRMRVRSPHDPEKWGEYREAGHELFVPDPSAPPWYKEEIIRGGRRYIIQPEWGHYPGEVIVDGEEHLVFIKVVWS